jgi:hypothetical protein
MAFLLPQEWMEDEVMGSKPIGCMFNLPIIKKISNLIKGFSANKLCK